MAIDYKKILLLIGITLIPFYEIIIRLFPDAVVLTPDTRVAKLSLSLFIAVGIGLAAFVEGVTVKVYNKWLLALVAFLFISINRSVTIPLMINNMDSSSFWLWKPLSHSLCYFIMFLGVSSLKLTKQTQKQIISTLYWTVLIMTFYVFFQWMGIDQWYDVKDVKEIGFVTTPGLIGNLGQPTLLSPFLGLGIVAAYSLKKWLPALFMWVFLLIIGSKMAVGATILASLLYLVLSKPQSLWLVLVIILIGGIFTIKDFKLDDTNGRYAVYKEMVVDWKTSPVEDGLIKSPAFTGIGLGSYGYLFPEKNKVIGKPSKFKQAHCEPLEILYCLGLFGFILYFMANYVCIKEAYLSLNYAVIPFLCAFVLLHLVSLGTFIFQLGVYQYLGVMLFGILSNKSLIGGE